MTSCNVLPSVCRGIVAVLNLKVWSRKVWESPSAKFKPNWSLLMVTSTSNRDILEKLTCSPPKKRSLSWNLPTNLLQRWKVFTLLGFPGRQIHLWKFGHKHLRRSLIGGVGPNYGPSRRLELLNSSDLYPPITKELPSLFQRYPNENELKSTKSWKNVLKGIEGVWYNQVYDDMMIQ